MNILLIIVDSARRDKFTSYGYSVETAPFLTRLARESWQFSGLPQSTWSLPSHASLFTGLYPSEHGLLRGQDLSSVRLPADMRTLAQCLRQQGYRTAGFSNNLWVGRLTGMERGFDVFVESTLDQSGETEKMSLPFAGRAMALLGRLSNRFKFRRLILYLIKRPIYTRLTRELVTRWILEQSERSEPWFAFVNFMDAHPPYYPPRRHLQAVRNGRSPSMNALRFNLLMRQYVRGTISGQELDALVHHYYDASLHYLDSELQKLFETLHDKEILEQTLVIITADHGKTMGEFDRNDDLHYLREPNISVPLWVRYPPTVDGYRRSQVPESKTGELKTPIELMTLYDTMLRWAGAERAENTKRSLTTVKDAISAPPPYAFVEAILPATTAAERLDRVYAIRTQRHKYIASQLKGDFLFDLQADPAEQHNVATEQPVILGQLRDYLQQQLALLDQADARADYVDTDYEAVAERLRALGYLD